MSSVVSPFFPPSFPSRVPGHPVERRSFEQPSGSIDGHALDWTTVPPAWSMWLSYRRSEAPSSEEIRQAEKYRVEVAARARALEMEEDKRRWRQAGTGGGRNRSVPQEPDMSAFVAQLNPQRSAQTNTRENNYSPTASAGGTATGQRVEVEAWSPARESDSRRVKE